MMGPKSLKTGNDACASAIPLDFAPGEVRRYAVAATAGIMGKNAVMLIFFFKTETTNKHKSIAQVQTAACSCAAAITANGTARILIAAGHFISRTEKTAGVRVININPQGMRNVNEPAYQNEPALRTPTKIRNIVAELIKAISLFLL